MPRRPDALAGFSSRFLADVGHLERTRNYLGQTAFEHALRRWTEFVRLSPYQQLRNSAVDPEFKRYARALPRKSARELRARLQELDDLY